VCIGKKKKKNQTEQSVEFYFSKTIEAFVYPEILGFGLFYH
jgi:hypothetical protein